MIRRDYILKMVQEFAEALARLRAAKSGKRWNEASGLLDEEFRKLVHAGPDEVARLSETDLLTRVMDEGPTQLVREKTLMLTRLLTEAGEVSTEAGRLDEARAYYLKALHLLLMVLAQNELFEFPDFVPKAGLLLAALGDAELPVPTLAMLMHYHERTGEFAKAEDALFGMLDSEPENRRIRDLGIAFYERLLGQSNGALAAGNLPRAEVEDGLKELRARPR